jgi:hypothetical protein
VAGVACGGSSGRRGRRHLPEELDELRRWRVERDMTAFRMASISIATTPEYTF